MPLNMTDVKKTERTKKKQAGLVGEDGLLEYKG
jgi:hypothetical protein